ncbi:hypothetical protein NDU88_002430 [Pleurodeles waltl]|uniref:Uncharacterized protein n=1 Tax=Pleurodeles waltl TaxID=8319 RepID=A0AAV7M0I5_PLEWA|nr:hypothetical protein NDU88_002430 [Pleurodeles waltl]
MLATRETALCADGKAALRIPYSGRDDSVRTSRLHGTCRQGFRLQAEGLQGLWGTGEWADSAPRTTWQYWGSNMARELPLAHLQQHEQEITSADQQTRHTASLTFQENNGFNISNNKKVVDKIAVLCKHLKR